MKQKETIILLEHSEVGVSFFQDLLNSGYDICYVGNNDYFSSLSKYHIKMKLPEEEEQLLHHRFSEIVAINPVGVICLLENLLPIYGRLLEKLGFKHNDPMAYVVCRDKNLARQIQRKYSLLNGLFEFYANDVSFEDIKLQTPFIVKPNYGLASAGVNLVKNKDEFDQAKKSIKRMNKLLLNNSGKEAGILCEEFVQGSELSVESLSVNGKVYSILFCDKTFQNSKSYNDYVYSTPSCVSEIVKNQINSFLFKYFEAIGYSHGPSHAEFIISNKTGEIFFLEAGLRVGFVGNFGTLANYSTGLNYNELTIRSCLQKITNVEMEELLKNLQYKKCLSLTPFLQNKGIISSIDGLDYLNGNSKILKYSFQKNVGDFISPPPTGMDVLGEIVAHLDREESVADFIKEFESHFRVNIK